ncbi:MAG TPA: MarR family transcriptional regulator [Ilumatobacteraceae bacterium]
MARTPTDAVDRIVEQWQEVRPDIDSTPIHIVGRVSRLSRLLERRLTENFATHGLEQWMYDVLATLRRNGEPYQLTAGELVRQTMVTTGAITNRVDRLIERGLVEREAGSDRRTVIVRLTAAGLRLVDDVVITHMRTEREALASLSPRQQEQLAGLLRQALVGLGDALI